MGVVARQSVSNTILMYVGVLIGYVNVTILFPQIIGEEGYGLTRVLLSLVFIGQNFVMLGTPSMLMKYFPRFQEAGQKGLLRFALGVMSIGFAVVATVFILGKDFIIDIKRDDSPLIEQYYFLILPILAFVTLYLLLMNVSRANKQSTVPVFVNEFLLKLLTTGLLCLSWYLDWSLDRFLIFWSLLYSSNVIVLGLYLKFKGYLDFGSDGSIDRAFVKESMDFSLFNMMAGASNSIISNVDVVMLGLLLATDSLALAGLYAMMVYLANASMMPTRGLSTISTPILSEYAENNDMEGMQMMYERTSLNQLITTGFLALVIFVNLPNLFEFMKVDYKVGAPVFVLIAITRIIQGGTGVNGVILNFSRYYRWTTYFVAGLAVLAIVSNVILIPDYGVLGAASASLLSYGLYELLKWGFVWTRLGLQPFHRKHLFAVLIGAMLLGLNYFIPYLENPFIDLFLRSALMCILAFIIIMRVNVAPDLRKLIVQSFSRLGLNIR